MGSSKFLGIGIVLLFIGGIVMISALDLSAIPGLSMVKVETPAGSVTIDEIDEEDAKRIGVGAIIFLAGVGFTFKGK